MGRLVRTLLAVVVLAANGAAQVPQPRQENTYRAPSTDTAPKTAPEVRPDRTITFRLRAPEASKVELLLGPGPKTMTKDSAGVWSITVGPLEPEIYTYAFVADGVRTIDMSNPNVTLGRSTASSIVEVPGSPARFDEMQDVPHGTLHARVYTSEVLKLRRRVLVYVPAEYDREPTRKFPVLYLRHGNGDLEGGWIETGRAGVILDNLVAQRRAVPMIIVMPNGYPSASGAGSSATGIEDTGRELISEIVPLVEKQYRVLSGPDNRAIAGLSMGGGQAFLTGLRNLDKFAWVAEFSSGVISDVDFRLEEAVPGFLEDSVGANKRIRLLFLSCGTEDPRHRGQLDLVAALKQQGIRHEWFSTPGAHEWKVWRHSLAALLQKLFQPLEK